MRGAADHGAHRLSGGVRRDPFGAAARWVGRSVGREAGVRPGAGAGGVAVGVAAVFIECHPDPDRAPSDGAVMVALREMAGLVRGLRELDGLAKGNTVLANSL